MSHNLREHISKPPKCPLLALNLIRINNPLLPSPKVGDTFVDLRGGEGGGTSLQIYLSIFTLFPYSQHFLYPWFANSGYSFLEIFFTRVFTYRFVSHHILLSISIIMVPPLELRNEESHSNMTVLVSYQKSLTKRPTI